MPIAITIMYVYNYYLLLLNISEEIFFLLFITVDFIFSKQYLHLKYFLKLSNVHLAMSRDYCAFKQYVVIYQLILKQQKERLFFGLILYSDIHSTRGVGKHRAPWQQSQLEVV